MAEFTKEALEDMRAWAKDPRGNPFWETVREMFKDGITNLRGEGRRGDPVSVSRWAAHTDTLEEVLDLPSLIIQNHAAEEKSGGEKA